MTPPPVLYVEDDEYDILLLRRAWARVNVYHPLQIVTEGRQAIAYLSGEGNYANRIDHPLPCLVLLDLKMPRITGTHVLRWIRSQPEHLALRVIVFSSSQQPEDINAAHALRIDAYFVKPGLFEEWVAMVDNLNVYWLKGR